VSFFKPELGITFGRIRPGVIAKKRIRDVPLYLKSGTRRAQGPIRGLALFHTFAVSLIIILLGVFGIRKTGRANLLTQTQDSGTLDDARSSPTSREGGTPPDADRPRS
jgi:hypothetical protein